MMDDKQHPNALGVVRMVAGIAPLVERSLKSIGSRKTAEVAH